MTREEAIRKHRKMWRWLAENPGRTKRGYLEKFDPEANLHADCYLCEYCEKHDIRCVECPLKWPGGSCDQGGLFSEWERAMFIIHYTRAAEIAKQIAELPEKEETK